jgi:hypothetical protein
LKLQIAGFDKVGRMMFNGKWMFDYRINALIHKYGSSLFALLPFFVQGPSSEPERVPPLSMNAIKLSKPLMQYAPEKGSNKSK